jgi:hypothetical protein
MGTDVLQRIHVQQLRSNRCRSARHGFDDVAGGDRTEELSFDPACCDRDGLRDEGGGDRRRPRSAVSRGRARRIEAAWTAPSVAFIASPRGNRKLRACPSLTSTMSPRLPRLW